MAVSANGERSLRRNAITNLDICNTRSNFSNNTGKLMSYRQTFSINIIMPLKCMEITSANPNIFDTHLDLPFTDNRLRLVENLPISCTLLGLN